MASSDLEMLLDMGFEKEKAELAVQKTGGLQSAIDWLDQNQDKTVEEIRAAEAKTAADTDADGPPLQPGEEAKSLVCNECGKKFRSTAQAEFHATKTEHTDFSESTEEIKPLTEEEREARLAELRARLANKRLESSEQDKIDKKKNEEIRRKNTKESQDVREDLRKKEQLKEAAAKRREKAADIAARQRVQAQIETDKAERRRKAEMEKAARAGVPVEVTVPATPVQSAPAPRSSVSHKEARLRLQTSAGTVQKTFGADITLFEVAAAISQENGVEVNSFTTNFPKKTFEQTDFGMTLKEAGLVPSAVLIVK